MPLPTAPAKRAALLSERDYDAVAARPPGPVKVESAPARPLTQAPPAPASASSPKKVTTRSRAPMAETAPTPAPAPTIPSKMAQASVAVKARKPKATGPAKLLVLDTTVLLHDPMCLFRFEEHDIFLPMIVLEELDGHKKGTTEVARNARQTSRANNIPITISIIISMTFLLSSVFYLAAAAY
jgi:PhoH-like ATPase